MNPGMDVDVVIAGAGPCGLMLACELGRRGIGCLLLDAKAALATVPQANATQARTMEHFRRLGFADEIRSQGLPPDHPTDIAYFTRFTGHELARLALPTARQARDSVKRLGGSWSAAELPHRISQKYVEATLLRHVEALRRLAEAQLFCDGDELLELTVAYGHLISWLYQRASEIILGISAGPAL